MLIIHVENNNIEKALKKLKQKVIATKQLQELRNKKEYKKPSVSMRKLIAKARYKQSKDL
jgi:small subunit ribosomal protein S21